MSGKTAWSQHASQLGYYRELAGKKGQRLEARVLDLVLQELRRDLRTRYQQSRIIYRIGSSYYWKEKEGEFARAAEQVLKEDPQSQRHLVYVATYLFRGLGHDERAIAILKEAHQRQPLTHTNQVLLVDFMIEVERYAEAIPILEPMVESHPDQIKYRTRLLKAFFHTNKMARYRQLLSNTDDHFRQQGRWNQNNIRALAECCLQTENFKAAAGFYRELIDLVKRQSGSGPNGTLANDYVNLARAYTGAGETKLAVDAASASIVIRNNRREDHDYALDALRRAMEESDRLQQFIDGHQQEVDKTGLDSPLLRQQIGLVLAREGKPKQAIQHYKKALELDPTSTKTRQLLIEAYEQVEDYSGMVNQTLAIIDSDRHTLEHFTNLVNRMKLAVDQGEFSTPDVERARTNIVEASPNEAEYHAQLAKIREEQQKWSAAAIHWQQVSKLQRLEPQGLQNLARVQVQLKRWEEAKATLQKLQQTAWPKRFESEVRNSLKQLLPQVP